MHRGTIPTPFAHAVINADRTAVNTDYVQTVETRNFLGPQTRVIYRIDLTKTNGYFFAQNIVLRDKDIVLVANAESTQIAKVLALIGGFTRLYFDVGRGAAVIVPN